MTATDQAVAMATIAAQAAADKLATDITIIDVSDRLAITDCFVVVTGGSDRQIGAIVDAVEEKMREAGHKPVRREGERDGRWVLLDFVDVVVHIQHAEERVYYALDRLWKDCPAIPFTDADAADHAAGTAAESGTAPAPAGGSSGASSGESTGGDEADPDGGDLRADGEPEPER